MHGHTSARSARSPRPSQELTVGEEFALLRARRRARMKAQATVGALAAQGNLGANIITDTESEPRAACIDAGEKPRP